MSALLTRARVRRLLGVASTQVVVQSLGFVSGIVLVRALSPAQYGYYTLAVAMIRVGNVLTELGIANAVMSIGGRLAGQRAGLRALVSDAHAIQAVLAGLAPCLFLPMFVLMLRHQQAPMGEAVALAALGVLCAFFNVRNTIAQSVARLAGHVAIQQKADLAMNAARLALLSLAGLVLLDATIASLLTTAVAAGGYLFWRAYLARQLGTDTAERDTHQRALRQSVWRQAPNCIYYVINGQLAVWLIGVLGSAERVADVGALGRLGAGFTVVMAVVATLVMPYFARAERSDQLESGFVALNAFFGAVLGLLAGLAMLQPGPILWVLGPHYANLQSELLWMVLATALTAWSGALYSVACARGWVLPGWLGIACGVAATIAGLRLFDLSTVGGSLRLTTLTACVALVVNVAHFGGRLVKHRRLELPHLRKVVP